jgi:hypothetical protein
VDLAAPLSVGAALCSISFFTLILPANDSPFLSPARSTLQSGAGQFDFPRGIDGAFKGR